jgi:hypothetical protein
MLYRTAGTWKLFQFLFCFCDIGQIPWIRSLEKSVVADPIYLKGLIQYKSSARINNKYYRVFENGLHYCTMCCDYSLINLLFYKTDMYLYCT